MADVRRYDPGQERDPDGKWGDGVPGSSVTGMSWAEVIDSYGLTYDEAEAGDFTVAVFERGDFTLFYRADADRYEAVRELDSDYADEIADALEAAAGDAEEQDLSDDEESEDAHDFVYVGEDDAIVGYTNGGQVMFSASKTGDPIENLDKAGNEQADQFWLMPDAARDLAEAIRDMIERFDEVNATERSRRTGEVRRYDPNQQRDPNGEWGDGVPGSSPLKDALRLAGRINLVPGETLVGSGRVDGDSGGIRLALTERDGRQMLRFGAGGEGYGQRNRDEGILPWDGNPSPAPLSAAERQRLDAEDDALLDEYEEATPERQEQIETLRDSIRERLVADDLGFNGTAVIDEYSARRLADRIRPALAEAIEQAKAENDAWDEIEELKASGNADPERMARLREVARVDSIAGITFDQGVIAGSEWGDIHYSVEMDDASVGAEVRIGVKPKGTPDDWGDDKDWMARLDAAETRKFLRLLERLTPSSTADRSQRGALVITRSFQPEDHPRAPAGSDKGGEFAKGGGGQKKATPKPGPKRRPASAATGTLAYDAATGQGTGYDSKDGDPRVHDLQQALNRLGIKDSAGKPLRDDGQLGPKTTSAVKALQRKLGVKPDGKVTPALLQQIKSMKSLPTKRSAFMDVCVRSFGFEFETRGRGNSDGRTLEGYAAVFNSPTRIAAVGGDFDEVISPGAFTRSIRSRMPVLQFEHGRDPRIGAAPIGSIEDLSEDSTGLHVRARLFDHPDIERVRQGIEARAIKGMSFRFQVTDGGDRWERRGADVDLRTVGDADVHELGPVVFPAYDTTTVSVRSLLAQLGPEEHRTLLRELAYDLRSLEPTGVGPSARSSGDVDVERITAGEEQPMSIRQRLDTDALRTRGITK